MIDSVFGFGTVETYDGKSKQLCVYVSTAEDWKQGYCSDWTDVPERKALSLLNLGEEMDGVWSQHVDTDHFSKEELHKKLTEAGFVYNEKFEEFMKDCMDEE